MDRYGAPSSDVQFWQGLDDVRGWREMFAEVSGVTVDDFYRDFRAHYDSLFGAIHVAIEDPVPDLPGALALSFGGGVGKAGYAYTALVQMLLHAWKSFSAASLAVLSLAARSRDGGNRSISAASGLPPAVLRATPLSCVRSPRDS